MSGISGPTGPHGSESPRRPEDTKSLSGADQKAHGAARSAFDRIAKGAGTPPNSRQSGLEAAIMHAHNELEKTYQFLINAQTPLSKDDKSSLERLKKVTNNILTAIGRGTVITLDAIVTFPLNFCNALTSVLAYIRKVTNPDTRRDTIDATLRTLGTLHEEVTREVTDIPANVWKNTTDALRGLVNEPF